MAHLLLLEVPGGNDFTVLEDAVAIGHTVTFFTADLARYEAQGARAREAIVISPFDYDALEAAALAAHARLRFDAILCILDIRVIEASRLAARLGLRFLNPATARLARDKVAVRQALAQAGVPQPRFAAAETAQDLEQAVAEVGYPALIKPADGYGSQNVSVIFDPAGLRALIASWNDPGRQPTDYGLGVRAGTRVSVEQYVRGAIIGCDVFSSAGERVLLGINDKLMFPPPSFAVRGGCFPSNRYDIDAIRAYAFQCLDAIDFDFGAAHVEMIVAPDGPYLVEINPRLVSAQLPFQMGYAFERSLYADLIDLHLGKPLAASRALRATWFSAIRWIAADRPGELASVTLPDQIDPAVRRVVLFKEPGDPVRPPINNGDRVGYVIAVGTTQTAAEQIADRFVRASAVCVR